MNIVFVVHRFHTNLYFVVKSLLKDGHHVEIIVPHIKKYEELIEDYSLISPHVIKEDNLSINYVYDLLDSWNIDVIVLRYFKGKFIYFSLVASFMGINKITYNQAPLFDNNLFKTILRPYWHRLIKFKPLKRFTPVRGVKGNFKEKFSTYIPMPIEPLINWNIREYLSNEVFRVLCVGKLGQERKKHLFLLDTLESIKPGCSVTFIGAKPEYATDEDYYQELRRRCKNSSLQGGAKIISNIPYKKMLEIYANFDLFILPSVRESLGMVVLEALASGCPVIVSDDVGAACYVENNVNGFIFNRNDQEDLKTKLNYLFKNPDKIPEMGKNALSKIKSEHSLEGFANNFISLVE